MASKKSFLEVDGRKLPLANLDKPMFPDAPFTKGQVIDYYIRASDYILPHIRNRPLTMKRYPDGIGGEVFYEKNAPRHTPEWVKTFAVPRSSGGTIHYVLVNDLATVVWTAGLANLEMHVFLSRVPTLERPTSIVFDLDPGDGRDVLDCGSLAGVLRALFRDLKLHSYAKVSGSKGMQIYIPLNRAVTFDLTSSFAKTVAQVLERRFPKLVISRMSKAERKGKIFIDWSQNSQSKTTVAVYSLRAKRERPYISLPFKWDEIEQAVEAGDADSLYLEPEDALIRLQKTGDLFKPLLAEKQNITQKTIELLAKAAAELRDPSQKAPKSTARSARHRTSLTRKEHVAAGGRKKPAQKKTPTSQPSTALLAEYDRKRNFSVTPEPSSASKSKRGTSTADSPAKKLIYVIQKHQASHLHFDFRLEMHGVLKSWAVPKGPPLKTSEKRLAMLVEDHPLDYASFEGTIPEGNYGAGTVMVWDTGTYECVNGKPLAAFFSGEIKLKLDGKKLKGGWVLVRDRRDERRWLLIMEKTAKSAGSKKDLDRSVQSGRTLDEIAQSKGAVWKSNRTAASSRRRRS